jgi:hypothetical protein
MRRWLVVVLAISAAACDAEQVGSAVRKIGSELADMTVRELGDLASRVADNPGVADSILSANGVDIAQLDAMLDRMGEQAKVVGAAMAEIPVGDLGDLASRITKDRAVADSLLSAHGIEAGQLDEVLDRIGPDAEALAAYLASLGRERNR